MGIIARAGALAGVPVAYGARLAGAAGAVAFGADKDTAYTNAAVASIGTLADALAKARGPALKFGQTLAMFSNALEPEQAQQLAALNRLFENAEPKPLRKLTAALRDLPDGVAVDDQAVAAASLGQVHRATWTDNTPVAVKIQYPDASRVVKADMLQLRALAPLIGKLLPTLDVPALVNEHAHRLEDELDYTHEAHWQETFRRCWQPEGIVVPSVRFATDTILVTDWVDGTSWTQLEQAPSRRRDTAGRQLARFCLWSPRLVGATHADMHPGNFRLLDDDRLAVLDFGSVAQESGQFTRLFASTWQLAAEQRHEELLHAWQSAGLVDTQCNAQQLLDLLDVDLRLWDRDEFTFTREWLHGHAGRFQDPARALQGARKLRFPPGYLLEHRAVTGMLALLCNIDTTVDFRRVLENAT